MNKCDEIIGRLQDYRYRKKRKTNMKWGKEERTL